MYISKVEALKWLHFLDKKPSETIFELYEPVILSIEKQIERAFLKKVEARQAKIPGFKNMKGRTHFVGPQEKYPKGCISCLFGDGLGGVRKTNTCNLKCKFCYYHDNLDDMEKIPDGMWEIGENLYDEDDLELLLSTQKPPTGIAYVYLEPFMEIEKYYNIVEKFHKAGVYQHMYTNGSLCTEENLKKLGEAGLDELRFNLGATKSSDKVIEMMAIAKKYIPLVGIETPMTPEFLEEFLGKKAKIKNTGIDFINCAEFHVGPDNINSYSKEKFYNYRNGYISPMWSREITLDIMELVTKENWDMVVHDCSNHTKYARELNKNKGGFGDHTYRSEFERFLPHLFLNTLLDEEFQFVKEEELPKKYQFDLVYEALIEITSSEEKDDFYEC